MTGQTPRYLLDTSAILAFYQGETGCDAVRELFEAKNCGEAIREVWPDEDLLWRAAAIMAERGLSPADSFIVASEKKEGAAVVHGDPEFGALKDGPATINLVG